MNNQNDFGGSILSSPLNLSNDEDYKVVQSLENIQDSIARLKYPAFICEVSKENANYLAIIGANERFLNFFNFEEKNIIGKDYDFIFDQIGLSLSSDNALEYTRLLKSIKIAEPCSVILDLRPKDQSQKRAKFKVTYNPINKDSDTPYSIFTVEKIKNVTQEQSEEHGTAKFIKDLERIAANERVLRKISYLIISDNLVRDISKQIAQILCEYLKADRCVIHDYKDGETTFVVEHCNLYSKSFVEENTDNFRDLTKYIDFQNHFYAKIKEEDRKNTILASHDILDDRSLSPIHEICKEYAIASQIAVTTVFNNQVNGGIYLHFAEKCDWPVDEIKLIELVADQYSIAIDRSFSIEKVMVMNKQLIEKTLDLKEAIKQEKKMRQMQSEFVAMVSHEFKTPLQIIDSTRELISRKVKSLGISDELLEKYFLKLQNGVMRMNGLIQSTLDLSRIEVSEGKIRLENREFNIRNLIHDIVEKNSNISLQKELQIVLDIEGLPDVFHGDQKALDHSFTNIITNAFKYSKNNTAVNIIGKVEGGNIIVQVIDHGIGIPKEDLDNIGQKFYRASNTLSVAGTGIGIYLTKYFVELHKGSVLIESEVDKGTSIIITLPNNHEK